MAINKQAAEMVRELTQKAAPHRLKIMDELGKSMTFLRQSFVMHFTKDIDKKKDKEHYVEVKIQQEKVFRQIKDYIHYEGGSSINPRYDGLNKVEDLLEKTAMMVKYLRYIGHTENLDNVLAKLGMTINVRALETEYPALSDEETKDNITKIFSAAQNTQSEICNESNAIKIEIFEELDDQIKYDAKINKSGIKNSEFDKLTALEAIKQKAEESAKKKLEAIESTTADTIDSKLNVQLVAQTIVDDSKD